MKIITFAFIIGLTIWLILMISNELAMKRTSRKFAEKIEKDLNGNYEIEIYKYDKEMGEPRVIKEYGKNNIPPKKK